MEGEEAAAVVRTALDWLLALDTGGIVEFSRDFSHCSGLLLLR